MFIRNALKVCGLIFWISNENMIISHANVSTFCGTIHTLVQTVYTQTTELTKKKNAAQESWDADNYKQSTKIIRTFQIVDTKSDLHWQQVK